MSKLNGNAFKILVFVVLLSVILLASVVPFFHVSYSAASSYSAITKVGTGALPQEDEDPIAQGSNVYLGWTSSGGVFVDVSHNNGTTYTLQTLYVHSSSNVQLAATPSHVYVAWSSGGAILFRASATSGATFTNANTIGTGQDAHVSANHQYVDVAWSKNYIVYFRQSTNYGKSFGPTIQLSQGQFFATEVQIASFKNNVYIVWENASANYNLAPFRSVVIATTHNGISFIPLRTLIKSPANITNREPEIKVNPYGFVFVIWRTEQYPLTNKWWSVMTIARSEDNGNTFPLIQNVSKSGALAREAKLEVSGAEVYAVFRYFNWTADSFDIYWVGSQNNGTSYSLLSQLGSQTKISLNLPSEFLDPQIAVYGRTVEVVWDANVTGWQIYMAKTTSYGAFWSVSQLQAAPTLLQAQIVGQAKGNFYFLWTSSGNAIQYFSDLGNRA